MSKGYWIVKLDIIEEKGFLKYVAENYKALNKYGAKFLARAGRYEVPEGETRSRNTIVEFPSYQDALDCWNSDEYQRAKYFREGSVNIDIVIVEGIK